MRRTGSGMSGMSFKRLLVIMRTVAGDSSRTSPHFPPLSISAQMTAKSSGVLNNPPAGEPNFCQ